MSSVIRPLEIEMQRPYVLIVASLFALSMCSVGVAESSIRLRPGEKLRKQIGSTNVQLAHHRTDATQNVFAATLEVDKDVRVARNDLPAGKYEVAVEVAKEDRVHVVFRAGDEELLRYAPRTELEHSIESPTIRLEIEEPPLREGRRRRRRHREPSVEFEFRWRDRRAVIEVQLTGRVWRSTPEPKLPDELDTPWSIVKSSLMGFVHQSMDEHVEHFANDFESDWDDGGSQEAHMQMIGRMLFEGEFEDTVLKLDQLKWEKAKEKLVFGGIVVQAPAGTFPLVYTVEKRSGKWKIVHLDGPKL